MQNIFSVMIPGTYDITGSSLNLPMPQRRSTRRGLLITAILCNDIDKVANLLQDPALDPMLLNNEALNIAAEDGYFDIVYLLLQDPRVDCNRVDTKIIRSAFIRGHEGIVRFLLSDPSFDPNREDYLGFAVNGGHTNVVKMLLRDHRTDLSNNFTWLRFVLCNARYKGYHEIVRLVEDDPRYKAHRASI